MTRIEYLEKLHDIAYQSNRADGGPNVAETWQKPEHAATHTQPVLDIVSSLLTDSQYQIFLDCFGDFDAFVALTEIAD